jgi:SAM-dependent methyltransferase
MKTAAKWTSGEAYERFMGRWSPHIASKFIDWLDAPQELDWLDVGSGTGALTRTILAQADPKSVTGVDPSPVFVEFAQQATKDKRASFKVGNAMELPAEDASADLVVCGLVLNFVPDPIKAVGEMKRACRAGGRVAAYVWDYAEGMQMLRIFWDAAAAVDPANRELDEQLLFPICNPDALRETFRGADLQDVQTGPIEFRMKFADFDDYWSPFLGGVGPAPTYVSGLSDEHKNSLERELRRRLSANADGSIELPARAWAVKGS